MSSVTLVLGRCSCMWSTSSCCSGQLKSQYGQHCL